MKIEDISGREDVILASIGVKMYFSLARSITEILARRSRVVKAVDGVNILIERGKVTCLVGESGCGKTTLGKLIVGLYRPTEGSIYYRPSEELSKVLLESGVPYIESKGGPMYDISRIKGKALKMLRREIQIVFQDPYGSLNPRMTIKDILEEPLIIHGYKDEKERLEMVIRALEDVKLTPPEEFLNRYPFQLSGGQRQRVNIARAIILGPRLVVADEPVSMLDVSIRAEILKLMLDLKDQKNLTYVFITHDLAVANIICDYINVMYLGRVVEYGPTDEILLRPKHPYTQALIAAVPTPDPKGRWSIKEVPIIGEVPSALSIPPGCRFHPRCPYAMEICKRDDPPYFEVGPKHYSACWLNKEGTGPSLKAL
ncbi:MAG: ABC transporter ATP-binding protein [Desulfurococcales archaeon]|jgi:peptide/nickel transport system ATP-binding protein|nr:ABC transporter ATP-binding protein [Desulfurococcales archaeon]